MSILKETLLEEYNRLSIVISSIEDEMTTLPKGALRKKIINGKNYYYLQYRNGKKVVSKYIKKDSVEGIKKQLERRSVLNKALKERKEDIALIKRTLRLDFNFKDVIKNE